MVPLNKQKKERIEHSASSETFRVDWHYMTGQVESLHRVDADQQFEWIRGRFGCPGGACFLDKRSALPNGLRHVYEYMGELRLTVERWLTEQGYCESYVWQNVGKDPIEIAEGDLCVYATLAEKYDIASVSLPYRAYTQDFCAHSTFYLYSAKVNGAQGGVGLVLTEGSVAFLTEERLDPRQRGDLLVNMPACVLQPQESVRLSWLLFAYDDVEGFWRVVNRYQPKIEVAPIAPTPTQSVSVWVDDCLLDNVWLNGEIVPNPFPCPEGDFLVGLPSEVERQRRQNHRDVGGEIAPDVAQQEPREEGETTPLEQSGEDMSLAEREEAQKTEGAQETPEQVEQAEQDEFVATQSEEEKGTTDAPCIPNIYWKMQGVDPVQRWAQGYRGLGRGKSNPRQCLVAAQVAMSLAEQEMADAAKEGRQADTSALQKAISLMLRYYRYEGGKRRVDCGLPYRLIAVNEEIKAYFVKQLRHALRWRSLFGRDYVTAMAEMTQNAYSLGLLDQETADRYQAYAAAMRSPYDKTVSE